MVSGNVVPLRTAPAHAFGQCANCCLLTWGQSIGLNPIQLATLDALSNHSRFIVRGEYLDHAGSARKYLHIIKSGCFKSSTGNNGGLEHITAFLLPGDWIGLDGVGSNRSESHIAAIQCSSVCAVSLSKFEQLCSDIPRLQHGFHQLLSKEITRDYGLMLLLAGMRAEERVTFFLLNLSARFKARGYANNHFELPMTNVDISSHLAIRNETLSRVFAKLTKDGLIAVNGRLVEVRDVEGLKRGLPH
jgi:CRP/FNR family transcriptional regulator